VAVRAWAGAEVVAHAAEAPVVRGTALATRELGPFAG
jgi:hypothetical protein